MKQKIKLLSILGLLFLGGIIGYQIIDHQIKNEKVNITHIDQNDYMNKSKYLFYFNNPSLAGHVFDVPKNLLSNVQIVDEKFDLLTKITFDGNYYDEVTNLKLDENKMLIVSNQMSYLFNENQKIIQEINMNQSYNFKTNSATISEGVVLMATLITDGKINLLVDSKVYQDIKLPGVDPYVAQIVSLVKKQNDIMIIVKDLNQLVLFKFNTKDNKVTNINHRIISNFTFETNLSFEQSNLVYILDHNHNKVLVVDPLTLKQVKLIDFKDYLVSLSSFNSQTKYLVLYNTNKEVKIVDLKGKEISAFNVLEPNVNHYFNKDQYIYYMANNCLKQLDFNGKLIKQDQNIMLDQTIDVPALYVFD